MKNRYIKLYLVPTELNETTGFVKVLEDTMQENQLYVNNVLEIGRTALAEANSPEDIRDVVRSVYGHLCYTFNSVLDVADILDVTDLEGYDNFVVKLASQPPAHNVSINPIHEMVCTSFADIVMGESHRMCLKIDDVNKIVQDIHNAIESPKNALKMGNKWVNVNPVDMMHTVNVLDAVSRAMVKASDEADEGHKEAYLLCVEQL